MEIIETGIQVRIKKEGYTGTVHRVFKNFKAIPSDFIIDKEFWLHINGYTYEYELLKRKWIAVDCFDGGQSMHPISEVKFI